ncbi:MAG TPA: amino acid permease [Desulfomonilia bacterium]|nr:amino acid permease [Desulfomonilia bacterium]
MAGKLSQASAAPTLEVVGSIKPEAKNSPLVMPTLGLVGATVNAMALIAPGAFLWITYQMQAAATAPSGASVGSDIWAGIVVALIIAFLTALSYSQLAKIYPEAGFASVTYFAEKAFLDRTGAKRAAPDSMARMSKLATGWAAHLFYWVYPGVMVAMFATMIGYIYTQFTGGTLSNIALTVIGVIIAAVIGYIAYRGVNGSTKTSIWINVIQLVTLVIFSGLAIWYRLENPQGATTWAFSGAWDIVRPHSLSGILVQSTLAILILVGFESCTALAAETKEPEKNIPKAIIISLVIQGLFAYLIEYFATGAMISEKLINGSGKTLTTGMAAAAASSAPIGDLAMLIGNNVLHGIGFGLMITMAVTVIIAIIGTTLSCMNTAIRVSAGMAGDRELPNMMGFIHQKFSTPHVAIGAIVIVSSIIAAIGVRSVVGLTGIALASNFGTFVLYGLTCVWTIIAFKNRDDFSLLKHGIIPGLGIIGNVVMVIAIIYLYSIGNADAKAEADICFLIAGAWALISLAYVALTGVKRSYSLKMISAMIRPDMLNVLVEILKDEELILGMTVTRVKGFGRQKGQKNKDAEPINDKISFIPKVRVDLVVNDWDVPSVMDIMRDALFTGNVGDGKIFVLDAKDAMRIRTGEKGVYAI